MHKLKFAYQTLCWMNYPYNHYGVEEVLLEIKDAGFEGIEFAEQMQHFHRVSDFPGLMEREGMKMASLSCGISYLPNDPATETKKRGEFAARFGVDALMLCGGYGPEWMTKDEGLFHNLAGNIDQLGEYLAQFGMKPAFHPHIETLVETYDDTERLLDRSKYCHICLDVAHFSIAGSDPVKFLKQHNDRVAMIHLKDWRNVSRGPSKHKHEDFCELGEGEGDIAGFLDAARDIGFPGWVVVELENTRYTPLESAKMSFEFLRSGGYL